MVPDTSAATVTKSHVGPQRRRNSEATPRCRGPCTRKPTEISGGNPIKSLEKVLKIVGKGISLGRAAAELTRWP
jgi:hypothetical protein